MKHLLERNRAWAARQVSTDSGFFSRLVQQQTPELLWIGCSDSRVPANQILDMPPGSIFVHRNVANLVVHTDLNLLSVLQFAVEVLKVRMVIVCGHYGCGGVRAAMEDSSHGLIDNWLRHIRDVQRIYRDDLSPLSPEARADRLCELNIIEQLRNVAATTIVNDAWSRGQPLSIHGIVYSISDGLLREVTGAITGPEKIDAALDKARVRTSR